MNAPSPLLGRHLFAVCFLQVCLAAMFGQTTAGMSSPDFQLRLNVDRVLVPVVVRDRTGHTIEGLTKGDFEVFDNGRSRAISGFAVERRGATSSSAAAGSNSLMPTATIFLFDDMHLDAADLVRARTSGMDMFASALEGNSVAGVVSISGSVNTGFTRSSAALQRGLEMLTPHPAYRPSETDCPFMDYYEADAFANKHDASAREDLLRKYYTCTGKVTNPKDLQSERVPLDVEMSLESSARRVLMAGRHDVASTLGTIEGLVQSIARLPARRLIIFISPGFTTIEEESLDEESRIVDLAALENVTISSLDARGLNNAQFRASRTTGPGTEIGFTARDSTEDVMSELADGTGGEFYHNSNDLTAGLKQLAERPDCVYILELSVGDVKRNGTVHKLNVKVKHQDWRVAARRAYSLQRTHW